MNRPSCRVSKSKGCYRDDEPNHKPISREEILNSFNNQMDKIIKSINNGRFRQYYLDISPKYVGIFLDGTGVDKIYYVVTLQSEQPFKYTVRLETLRRNNYTREYNSIYINENEAREYDMRGNNIGPFLFQYNTEIKTKFKFDMTNNVKNFIKSPKFKIQMYPESELSPEIILYKIVRDNLKEIIDQNRTTGVYNSYEDDLSISYTITDLKKKLKITPEVLLTITNLQNI